MPIVWMQQFHYISIFLGLVPSTSDYESSSAATSNLDSYEDEEPTSAVPSSTQPPTEEPNTPDSSEPSASPAQPEQEYTDLSF